MTWNELTAAWATICLGVVLLGGLSWLMILSGRRRQLEKGRRDYDHIEGVNLRALELEAKRQEEDHDEDEG